MTAPSARPIARLSSRAVIRVDFGMRAFPMSWGATAPHDRWHHGRVRLLVNAGSKPVAHTDQIVRIAMAPRGNVFAVDAPGAAAAHRDGLGEQVSLPDIRIERIARIARGRRDRGGGL